MVTPAYRLRQAARLRITAARQAAALREAIAAADQERASTGEVVRSREQLPTDVEKGA